VYLPCLPCHSFLRSIAQGPTRLLAADLLSRGEARFQPCLSMRMVCARILCDVVMLTKVDEADEPSSSSSQPSDGSVASSRKSLVPCHRSVTNKKLQRVRRQSFPDQTAAKTRPRTTLRNKTTAGLCPKLPQPQQQRHHQQQQP
jgi:hypothetical protein